MAEPITEPIKKEIYTLYYLNENLQIGTLKVETLDAPILIPENLVFCDLRKGIHFIKEPHECIDFTDIERLFMQSQFNDVGLIKDGDYRRQNTYLTPLCPIDAPPLLGFAFEPSYWRNEGCLTLEINQYDLSDTKVYFSVDGVDFSQYVLDCPYWLSPAGYEELNGAGMFGDSSGKTDIAIYLDPSFLTDTNNSLSVPELKYFYFKTVSTGAQSPTYNLSNFFV